MQPTIRSSASTLGLLLASLGLAVVACAQTAVIELNFNNSDFAQTGSAGTTFSPYSGNVTFGAGIGGGTAAVFDGSTSLQASDTPVTTALTVSFWMNTTTDNGLLGDQWYQGAGLVDGELGGDTTDWGISQIGTQLAFGIGSSDSTIFSTSSVNTGNWIHVAATWDDSGMMNLYINGSLEASYGGGSFDPRDTSNQFLVGQDLSDTFYTGSLDEIRIYDTTLSGGQIAGLAAIPEPSTCAMLFGLGALGLVMLRRRRLVA